MEAVTIVLRTSAEGQGIQVTANGLQKVQQAVTAVDAAFSKISSTVSRLIAPLATLLSGAALVKFTKESIEAADAAGKASQAAGQSVEKFTALSYAAGLASVGTDQLKSASKNLAEWLAKNGQYGKDLTQAFLEQADVIRQTANGGDRLRMMQERFGKGAQELIPLLSQGSDEIRKQMLEAKELGLVIGDQFAQKASQFNDSISKIKGFARGVFNSIADAILPTLIDLSETVVTWAKTNGEALRSAFKDGEIEKAFSRIADTAKGVLKILLDLGTFGVAHINALTHAVELLAAAFALLALRMTVAAIPAVTKFLGLGGSAGLVGTFTALNRVVTLTSQLSGPLAGIVASLSTFGGVFAILMSGLVGFKAGQIIGEFKVFGATINDVVTYNFLKALEAWEKLKLSLGMGSQNQLKGVQDSIANLFVPPGSKASAEAPAEDSNAPYTPPTVDKAETIRLNLQRNAVLRSSIQDDVAMDEEQKNARLQKVLSDRLDLLKKLRDELNSQHTTDERGLPEGILTSEGLRYTEAYKKVASEINGTLTEQKKLEEEIFNLRKNSAGFINGLKRDLTELADKFRDVGASVAKIMVDGVKNSIDAVSFGIWEVIDGTQTWADLFRNVARQMISQMLQMVITQALVRGAMLATAAAAELMGATSLAASIRAFTASAMAGAGKSGEQGGWVGVLVYLGVMAAALGTITAMTSGFATGGVVDGGQQIIRVNEGGREAVLNAQATAMLGEGVINELNAGRMDTLSAMADRDSARSERSSSSIQRSKQTQPQHFVFVDSRNDQAYRDFMVSTEGKAIVVDIMRDMRLEAGLR